MKRLSANGLFLSALTTTAPAHAARYSCFTHEGKPLLIQTQNPSDQRNFRGCATIPLRLPVKPARAVDPKREWFGKCLDAGNDWMVCENAYHGQPVRGAYVPLAY